MVSVTKDTVAAVFSTFVTMTSSVLVLANCANFLKVKREHSFAFSKTISGYTYSMFFQVIRIIVLSIGTVS